MIFLIVSAIPTALYAVFDMTWLSLPWLPIAVIGTAVAFLVGFKNNATYDRLWEARKIWGAIVNSSRTWGIMTRDFITHDQVHDPATLEPLATIHQRLIYRHVAWLTALRYQLRQPRNWENMTRSYNREIRVFYDVPEYEKSLEEVIEPYLSKEDLHYVLSKKNRATQLISLQSREIKELKQRGLIDNFRHVEVMDLLRDLYTQQGKCERIKNFPYPRQYSTISLIFIWVFIVLLPFGMVQEFAKLSEHLVWLTIPFATLVSWVFHTMDKMGEASENPFEGGPNDIPMAALSRTIEIDLREMLDETDLPQAAQPTNQILM